MKDFKLPDLGENVAGGDIVQVLVKEGDVIKAEQPVVEVETDKAVVEVPCPFGGRIAKIHVQAGQKVKVGAALVSVEENGSAAPAPSKPSPSTDAATSAPKKAGPPPATQPKAAAPAKAPAHTDAPTAASKASRPVGPPPQPKLAEGEPIPAGPATRRLARELGVELRDVAARFPGERLTEEHVKKHVKEVLTGPGAAPGGGGLPGVHVPPLPDFSQWGDIERLAFSSLQRKTAEHLSAAWLVAPHVTHFDEADISALEALRKRFQQSDKAKEVKLTVTAFVLKAVAIALKEFPKFNASYDAQAGELVLKRYYHIGVAVDTEAGLIVPVLRDVDAKPVLQVAAEMNELADRTRKRKVAIEELRGGTFTVTNLGGIGGVGFTPIINYPEVAILGMSRSREVPVLREGKLATRLMMPLSLSYDHRVVNGADGARFCRRVAALLEDPELLLLEA